MKNLVKSGGRSCCRTRIGNNEGMTSFCGLVVLI